MEYESDDPANASRVTNNAADTTYQPVDAHVDSDTIRIMVSTDNHLGYAERDPIRGYDSFAAFEEVLLLSKLHNCDMVLLAGDLFHDNKPSRQTLHKTMEIIRRYCMGPNPVQLEIVSNHISSSLSSVSQNNNSNRNNGNSSNNTIRGGKVNYEDEYSSVDLPIFSIHGNHDDPTRDGGTEMLAALDLLSVTNLLNYFGRQDEVDKVEVSPILIRKGSTRLALYGMGSMRDERLNRMWQGKKVRFLRPEQSISQNDDDDDEEDESPWFNIFALHQNRDLGRGTKNCVHESMIPEWMDLVVWGHEHECLITPSESAVGTFRISQPGSSVATSLSIGEARRKHVGVLDIRGSQFRLTSIPLTQVRSFAMGEISLQDQPLELIDPQDPNVDSKITALLEKEVHHLINEARETSRMLLEDTEAILRQQYGHHDIDESVDVPSVLRKLKYKVTKPEQVLIRLKVEHAGFTSLNNQRFGSRFVGEVANPSDILLFHRRRKTLTAKEKKHKAQIQSALLDQPIRPDDLAEVNVEDLIEETLELSDKKLELLDQQQLGIALDEFVVKEVAQAFNDTVDKIMHRQQKKLIKRGIGSPNKDDDDDDSMNGDRDNKITTANAVREVCLADAEKARKRLAAQRLNQKEQEDSSQPLSQNISLDQVKKRKNTRNESDPSGDEEDHDNTIRRKRPLQLKGDESESDDNLNEAPSNSRPMKRTRANTTNSRGNSRVNNRRQKVGNSDSDDDEDNMASQYSRANQTKTNNKNKLTHGRRNQAKSKSSSIGDDSSDDDLINISYSLQSRASSQKSARPTRKAAAASSTSTRRGRKNISYNEQDSEEDNILEEDDDFVPRNNSQSSKTTKSQVLELSSDDDEVVDEVVPVPKKRRTTSRLTAATTTAKKTTRRRINNNSSQSQVSPVKSQQQTQLTFTSVRKTAKGTSSRRPRRTQQIYNVDAESDSDEDDNNTFRTNTTGAGMNWGTAQVKKRSR